MTVPERKSGDLLQSRGAVGKEEYSLHRILIIISQREFLRKKLKM